MSSKIHAAMIEIMKKVAPIAKDRTNTFHKFNFRGIDDIYNALNAVMGECGVYSLPTVIAQASETKASKNDGINTIRIYTIRYDFFAIDGSTVSATVVGEAMDSADKASNKAMAVAHKYALLQAFCIPTEEPKDPDADAGTQASAEAALNKPPARWTNALQALAAVGKHERDVLNHVKRADWRGVTDQDYEVLQSWYQELTRDGGRTA